MAAPGRLNFCWSIPDGARHAKAKLPGKQLNIRSFARFEFGLTISILAAASAVPAFGQLPASDYREISIDASRATGHLKPLRGVNGAPDMGYLKAGDQFEKRPPDISAAYVEAHVSLVRTHDAAGAADIDSARGGLPPLPVTPLGVGAPTHDDYLIFPDLSADPADPASYHFGATDRLISGIRATGAEVIFRLGRGGATTASPPLDPAAYGEIVRHIVMHYNKGWDDGFLNGVKYWEFWNEPDFYKIYWRGTPEQFWSLYGIVARSVKAADPGALVGGPAIALSNNDQPFREGFLAFAKDNSLPLDFFSWHWYSMANDPYDYVRISRDIRALLDGLGYRGTRSILDEWNSDITHGGFKYDAQQAAYVVTSRIYMQNAPIDEEAYYRADGAYGADGKSPSKVARALVAMGRMSETPELLAATGGDTDGFAVLAGRSTAGTTVQVLVSNYEVPPEYRGLRPGGDTVEIPGVISMRLPRRRAFDYHGNKGYRLALTGLDARTSYVVERYRISATDDLSLVGRSTMRGPVLRLSAALPAPAVELLVIRAAD
jgi:xylan 1,4-beta-xylosidase